MGLFRKMYKKGAEKAKAKYGVDVPDYDVVKSTVNGTGAVEETSAKASKPPNTGVPPTRWEKAVMSLNSIVTTVAKIDPDGVDIVCFPGSGGEGGFSYDIYRNIRDANGLEDLVTAVEPKGECRMGATMDVVLKEAFARGFDSTPTSVLVLTAGCPDDSEQLTKILEEAAKKVDKDSDLTVTFVQVGDDEEAEKYLAHLDTELTTISAGGEEIDIVDTVKDEDIQKAVTELKENKGTTGGLIGAFTGAALGAGGMYFFNKQNANKRTEGWNGTWKVTKGEEEAAIIEVKDDLEGNLELTWPGNETSTGSYAESEDGETFNIQHMTLIPTGEVIVGTIEDEHNITWDNGAHWEEIPPEGVHWGAYAGAAAAGAATGGATGYLLDKKFFDKASKKVPSDYVVVLDRSAKMAIHDSGK
mmetsp:Transcript_28283/g.60721  ORF Transcript_28283/g.60721 Transcript_28283/m.60721 type:complete len:415 (-) Transcript_28283:172-1416(-)